MKHEKFQGICDNIKLTIHYLLYQNTHYTNITVSRILSHESTSIHSPL